MLNDGQKLGLWFILGTLGLLASIAIATSWGNAGWILAFFWPVFIVPIVIGSLFLISGSASQLKEKSDGFSSEGEKISSSKRAARATRSLGWMMLLVVFAPLALPFVLPLFIDSDLSYPEPELFKSSSQNSELRTGSQNIGAENAEGGGRDAGEVSVQENSGCVSTLTDYTDSWTQRRCIVENRGAFHIYFISESVLSTEIGAIGEKWKPKSAQFEQAPGTIAPSSIQFVYDVEGSQRGGEVPLGVIQIVEKQKGRIDFDAYLAATKNGSDITENINPKYKNDSNFSYQREIKREQIDGITLFFDQIKRSDGKIFEPALVFRLGDTDIAINGAHAEALSQDELRTYMLAFARALIQSE